MIRVITLIITMVILFSFEVNTEAAQKTDNIYIASYGTDAYRVWVKQPNNYWIRYEIRKFKNSKLQLSAWRIADIDSLKLESGTPITTNIQKDLINLTSWGSNFEYAIKIKGDSDFFGGGHGHEITKSVQFLIDGKNSNIKNTIATELEMIQQNTIYNPLNQTEKLGDLIVKHRFTNEGLQLIWKLKWVKSCEVVLAYGAMLPAKRAQNISTKLKYAHNPKIYDVSSVNHGIKGINDFGIELRNSKNKIKMSVSFQDKSFFNNFTNSAGQGIWVYQGAAYNKVYPTRVYTPNSEKVKKGDIWELNTKYKISN